GNRSDPCCDYALPCSVGTAQRKYAAGCSANGDHQQIKSAACHFQYEQHACHCKPNHPVGHPHSFQRIKTKTLEVRWATRVENHEKACSVSAGRVHTV